MKNSAIEMIRDTLTRYFGVSADEITKVPDSVLLNEELQLYTVTCFYPDSISNSSYVHVIWSDAVEEAKKICFDMVDDDDDDYDYDIVIDDENKNCVIDVFDDSGEVYLHIIVNKVYNSL